jgi:hypothetical protein
MIKKSAQGAVREPPFLHVIQQFINGLAGMQCDFKVDAIFAVNCGIAFWSAF